MQRTHRFQFGLLLFSLAVAMTSAVGQVVTATVPVGTSPYAVAVNSGTNKIYVANSAANTVSVIDGATNNTTTVNVGVAPNAVAVDSATNKIYVVNQCGNDSRCASSGTVTVIDGATNNTTSVNVGAYPYAVAVNPVTNRIYVVNSCGNDVNCGSLGTVTIINGTTNNTTTANVGAYPYAVAVNPVTNQIYTANQCGNDLTCASSGTVTVIDGATNNTTSVNVDYFPSDAEINSVTNQIYVANNCGSHNSCNSAGTITVIDGVTHNTLTVTVGIFPYLAAVNPVTNQIYAANQCGNDPTCQSAGTVSVIDGTSNMVVTTANVGFAPGSVGVDLPTNKIYVANACGNDPTCQSAGTVTMIDGATYSTTTVTVGKSPQGLAVNPVTSRIYVANFGDNTVSVIAGASASPAQFVAVTPCRLYDTRPQYGGSGPIPGGTSETFNLPQLAQSKGCADLSLAVAYSLNVAVVPHGYLGYLTMWPTGEDQPLVATLNSLDGRIKANAAILPARYQGAISVYVTNTTDVVLDIDGYFAPVSSSTLAFYPLSPPCRVADTRSSMFPPGLGTPHLSGGAQRDFPVLASPCGIPNTAQGYSLNLTAVPYPGLGNPLGYLEVWPKGQKPQNPVSTLNNLTGTIVANAALVPAGTGGEITVYPSNDTDLVIDANGYFAAAGQGGMSLYPAAPCRVIDTRKIGSGQPFSGTLSPPVDVVDSQCGPPSTAQAYVFNATVVPSGGLGYLTLWPDGTNRPTVSTLNALDGSITNNMAIVPSTNEKVDAYASGITQLILDISSYFAP
jgi:YVTN family beta-propeller protein